MLSRAVLFVIAVLASSRGIDAAATCPQPLPGIQLVGSLVSRTSYTKPTIDACFDVCVRTPGCEGVQHTAASSTNCFLFKTIRGTERVGDATTTTACRRAP